MQVTWNLGLFFFLGTFVKNDLGHLRNIYVKDFDHFVDRGISACLKWNILVRENVILHDE